MQKNKSGGISPHSNKEGEKMKKISKEEGLKILENDRIQNVSADTRIKHDAFNIAKDFNALTDKPFEKKETKAIDPTFGTGKIKTEKKNGKVTTPATNAQLRNMIKTTEKRNERANAKALDEVGKIAFNAAKGFNAMTDKPFEKKETKVFDETGKIGFKTPEKYEFNLNGGFDLQLPLRNKEMGLGSWDIAKGAIMPDYREYKNPYKGTEAKVYENKLKNLKSLSEDTLTVIDVWATKDEAAELYKLKKSGDNVAFYEKLRELAPVAIARRNEYEKANAEKLSDEHPFLAGTFGIASGLVNPIYSAAATAEVLERKAKNEEIDFSGGASSASRYMSELRSNVSENSGKVGGFIYQTAASIGDMVGSMFLGGAIGSAAGSVTAAKNASGAIMAGSAAAGAMMNAYDRGGNENQILLSGIAAGVAEMFFERFSIEGFFNIMQGPGRGAIKEALKSGDKMMLKDILKRIASNMGKQSLTEAWEEGATEIANILSDVAIMGNKSEFKLSEMAYMKNGLSKDEATKKTVFDKIAQVATSAAAGAVSGGVMGAGGVMISDPNFDSDFVNQWKMERNAFETFGRSGVDFDTVNKQAQTVVLDEKAKKDAYERGRKQLEEVNKKLNEDRKQEAFGENTAENINGGNDIVNDNSNDITFEVNNDVNANANTEVQSEAIDKVPEARAEDVKFDNAIKTMEKDISDYSFITSEEEAAKAAAMKNIYAADLKNNSAGEKSYGLALNKEMLALTSDERGALFTLSKKLNKRIVIKDGLKNASGQIVAGEITKDAIYINSKSKYDVIAVASHEAGHRIKNLSEKGWSRYQQFIVKRLKQSGDYESVFGKYEKAYTDLTSDQIHEEIACDYISKLFENEAELIEFIKKDRSLATRIKGIWHALLSKVGGNTQAARNARIERAKDLWQSALAKAEKAASVKNVNDNTSNMIDVEDVKELQSIGRKSVNDFTSEDIKKSEPFARKFFNEIGVKSPFFRAWFGDWRANDTTVVNIANKKGAARGITRNIDTGWDIQVSGKVFNETKSHNQTYNVNARPYLDYINSIVENAVLLDSYTIPSTKAKSANSAMMHSLYALADMGNGIELLKLYVEELNDVNSDGTIKRSYQLQNITNQQLNDRVQDNALAPSASTADTHTISQLFSLVKNCDKNFKPKPVNPLLLNEDGTPKVVYHGTDAEFTVFDSTKGRANMDIQGMFFSPYDLDAQGYGENVGAYYLNLRNPADEATAYKALNLYKGQNYAGVKAREYLIKLGYDGVYNGYDEYIAFYPEQIKSATDNIGTFDKDNPDIRYMVEMEEDSSKENFGKYDSVKAKEIDKRDRRIKELETQLENANIQLLYNEGKGIDTDATLKISEEIRKDYSSYISKRKLHRDITALYNYMSGREVDSAEAIRRAKEIAKSVIDKSYVKTEALPEYEQLRQTIRNTKILVPMQERESFADGYEYFRKKNFGALKLSNEGTDIDVFYEELCEEYPELFETSIQGAEERLNRILEVKEEISDKYEKAFSDEKVAADRLSQQIMAEFLNTPQESGNSKRKVVFYDPTKQIESERKRTERARISRDRSIIIPRIGRNYNYIKNKLLKSKGTDGVPERMRTAVADILDRFEEYTQVNKADLKNPEQISVSGMKKAIRKAALHEAYRSIMELRADGDKQLLEKYIDSDLMEQLRNLSEDIPQNENGNFKKFSDMKIHELQAVDKFLCAVNHAIVSANKSFCNNIKGTISENAEAVIADAKIAQEENRKKSKTGDVQRRVIGEGTKIEGITSTLENALYWDTMDANTFAELYGGKMGELIKAEREAFDDYTRCRKLINETTRAAVKDLDIKKMTDGGAVTKTFTTQAGNIELTRSQMMSLYALWQRPQARMHIEQGGIEIKKVSDSQKSDLNIYKISKSDVGHIISDLSEAEKKCVHELVSFMSTTLSEWGNETSMKLYGYEKYHEKWYFPIKSSEGTLSVYYGEKGEGNIRNPSFSKSVVKNAANALVLDDFFDVYLSHCDEMAAYSTLGLPMLDVERVLNYKLYQSAGDGSADKFFDTMTRRELEKAYGKKYVEYIKKLHEDINGITKQNADISAIDSIVSLGKRAAIAYNVRVALQQPTAITRAFLFIDPKYIPYINTSKAMYNEMVDVCPIAYHKSMGFYEIGLGPSLKDVALGIEHPIADSSTAIYGVLDDKTWTAIYAMVKKETQDTHKNMEVGSDEFNNIVQKRFNEIIDRTQVVDTVFHRAQNMKSKNSVNKIITSFYSEPQKTLNLYRTQIIIAGRSGELRKKLPKIAANYAATAFFTAIAQTIPDLWREKDEDKLFDENGNPVPLYRRAAGKLLENSLNNMNPVNLIPFVNTMLSALQGDFNVIGVDNIERVGRSFKNLFNDKLSTPARVYGLLNNVSKLLGVGVGNLFRDLSGIGKSIYKEIGGDYYASYNLTKWNYDITKPENKGKFIKYYDMALVNGNTEEAQLIMEDYLSYGSGKKEKPKTSAKVQSVMKEVQDLNENADKELILFSVPSDNFSVGDGDYIMDSKEYGEYSQKVYDTLMKMAFKYINSDEYGSYNDEEKRKALSYVKKYAAASARKEVNEDYELTAWQENIYSGKGEIGEYIDERIYSDRLDSKKEEYIDIIDMGDYSNESEYIQIKAEDIEKMAAGYYAKKELDENYEPNSNEKKLAKFEDELSMYMTRDEYLRTLVSYYAYHDELVGRNGNLKKAELCAFINGTVQTAEERSALFDCIPHGNLKNPY